MHGIGIIGQRIGNREGRDQFFNGLLIHCTSELKVIESVVHVNFKQLLKKKTLNIFPIFFAADLKDEVLGVLSH